MGATHILNVCGEDYAQIMELAGRAGVNIARERAGAVQPAAMGWVETHKAEVLKAVVLP
ncbi:MAG: hypothetical protein WCP21_01815 [Armatimonadota bacterium]